MQVLNAPGGQSFTIRQILPQRDGKLLFVGTPGRRQPRSSGPADERRPDARPHLRRRRHREGAHRHDGQRRGRGAAAGRRGRAARARRARAAARDAGAARHRVATVGADAHHGRRHARPVLRHERRRDDRDQRLHVGPRHRPRSRRHDPHVGGPSGGPAIRRQGPADAPDDRRRPGPVVRRWHAGRGPDAHGWRQALLPGRRRGGGRRLAARVAGRPEHRAARCATAPPARATSRTGPAASRSWDRRASGRSCRPATVPCWSPAHQPASRSAPAAFAS